VSAGIDLLLNLARRREVSRAEELVDEVAERAAKVAGWHGWQWQMRLAEARAEIALARGDWEEALRPAEDTITQSRASGRVKYQVAGLRSRAQALASLGRHREAIADLRSAVALARPIGDPAMFLHTAAALLAIEGDDTLAAEARAAAHRILAALPDAEMRRRFEAAEPVRRLGKLESVPPRTS
jgi:tetratricopeptide (TPR) repeat protein